MIVNPNPQPMATFQIGEREFELQTKLGEGVSGKTYLYREQSSGQLYTVKVIKLGFNRRLWDRTRTEIKILELLKRHCEQLAIPCFEVGLSLNYGDELHSVFGGTRSSGPIAVIMYQFAAGVTLFELTKSQPVVWSTDVGLISAFLSQLLSTIQVMHNENVVHRDIKTANIIYNDDSGRFTLIDFGLSCQQVCSSVAGTPNYVLPVILRGEWDSSGGNSGEPTLNQFKQSDLYAIGVCAYHMITHSYPRKVTIVRDSSNRIIEYRLSDYVPLDSVLMPDYIIATVEDLLLHSDLGIDTIYQRWLTANASSSRH